MTLTSEVSSLNCIQQLEKMFCGDNFSLGMFGVEVHIKLCFHGVPYYPNLGLERQALSVSALCKYFLVKTCKQFELVMVYGVK